MPAWSRRNSGWKIYTGRWNHASSHPHTNLPLNRCNQLFCQRKHLKFSRFDQRIFATMPTCFKHSKPDWCWIRNFMIKIQKNLFYLSDLIFKRIHRISSQSFNTGFMRKQENCQKRRLSSLFRRYITRKFNIAIVKVRRRYFCRDITARSGCFIRGKLSANASASLALNDSPRAA